MKKTLFYLCFILLGGILNYSFPQNYKDKSIHESLLETDQEDLIREKIMYNITSQIGTRNFQYDESLHEILEAKTQGEVPTHHPDFSSFLATLPYGKRFYSLLDYEYNLDSLSYYVSENTFYQQRKYFSSDCYNSDPRHEDSPENINGYRYAIKVEFKGNGLYEINTVIAPKYPFLWDVINNGTEISY